MWVSLFLSVRMSVCESGRLIYLLSTESHQKERNHTCDNNGGDHTSTNTYETASDAASFDSSLGLLVAMVAVSLH